MNLRFTLFFLVITTVLLSGTYYIGHRWMSRSVWAKAHKKIVWLTLGLFVVLQLLGPMLYRMFPDRLNSFFILHWITYTTLGMFACMFFYTLASDAFVVLWTKVVRPNLDTSPYDLERRSFLGVSLFALSSASIGLAQAVTGPKVYKVDVPIEGLPPELDGFRIVQISDLHLGPTLGRAFAERVARMTEALKPDLIALTGDMVDGSVQQLQEAMEPLIQLQAPHGLFFVTGNHEYYWGALDWIEEYRRRGVRVLLNEHVVLTHGGQPLVLAGVPDNTGKDFHSAHVPSPSEAVRGAPKEAIKILLAHRPNGYQNAADAGFHLQLSGHTHGGQFFPWSVFVSLAYRYYIGLNRHEKLWVYVNRGTGYWGPPIRFTVPSEITLLRLSSKRA